MNTFFYSLAKTFKISPISILKNITKQKNIFPFYHLISDVDVIHVKNLYNIRNVKKFEDDLDFFLKNYRPIDLYQLMEAIESGKPLKNVFLLSFDDGLSQFHDIIAPILTRKGIPAVVFLNPAFIDNKDLFFRYKESVLIEKYKESNISDALQNEIEKLLYGREMTSGDLPDAILSINYVNRHCLTELAQLLNVDFQDYLKKHQPYLTTAQINSLITQGFQFGSHSIDHPQYEDLELEQQIYQTDISMKNVRQTFSLNYNAFSFPFTDYGVTKKFFELIYKDEQPLVDITFGCAGLKKDTYNKNIQRIPIEINDYSAQDVIIGEYLYYIFKSLINKNTIKR